MLLQATLALAALAATSEDYPNYDAVIDEGLLAFRELVRINAELVEREDDRMRIAARLDRAGDI